MPGGALRRRDNGRVPDNNQVVIVGGGIVGSCTALFLGRAGAEVTVVERDPSYDAASTTRSASAIRQLFHLGLNVAMSRYGYRFFHDLAESLPEVPGAQIDFTDRGYLVLATPDATARLEEAFTRQVDNGGEVVLLEAPQLEERFPWLRSDDLGGAILGVGGEGWFDPRKALGAVRTAAETAGARFVHDDVVGIDVEGGSVTRVRLASGRSLGCSAAVDAAGPHAAAVAALAGVSIPVESRKRTVFVFRPPQPVGELPNLVDPTVAGRGMYMRPYGDAFMAVTSPPPERDPDTSDLEPDLYLFDDVLREALARRIRGFEEVQVVETWAGHYELNTFDQNAIIGRHPEIAGLYLACAFSGHGVMHAPAAGRGIAELVTAGRYETLDLSPFSVERIERGEKLDDIQPSEVRKQRAGL